MNNIKTLAQRCHETAKAKGFWESDNVGEKLMLIVSEVSEACEADRKTDDAMHSRVLANFVSGHSDDAVFIELFEGLVKDTFADELADVVIRVFDLAAYKGIDIESHILAKMRYNETRPPKHGKKY